MIKKRKRIFLDYAATTPLHSLVKREMDLYWTKEFGNPGGLYQEGVAAQKAVLRSREVVARALGARSQEIVFTSGGTEANNLAIFGFVEDLLGKGLFLKELHFITSTIEHPSVLECFRVLQQKGASVSYIGVTEEGVISLSELQKELRGNTVFVSVMFANNEIGSIQPIADIAKAIRHYRKAGKVNARLRNIHPAFPFFHTDASQVLLFEKLNVKKYGVDMLTIDGHKIYGPKGVGALYLGSGVLLSPIFHGGGQERGFRAGTEPVPLIVGFAKAVELAEKRREKESVRLTVLRDYCIDKLLKLPGVVLNGGRSNRLPNNVNISLPGIDNEWMVLQLDAKGIAISTKSACLSMKTPGSYVVEALGKSPAISRSTLRFSMGAQTTRKDLVYAVSALKHLLAKG
ncbi:MAG TPA: cysteine desulfurase family protein [Candidatus Paceibacterota bacterium]